MNPDGLLFCVATPNVTLSNATFALSSLAEGGSQFTSATQEIFKSSGANALQDVSFFQVRSSFWNHEALEYGTLYDVLANDEHYASSYQRRRYDDLQATHGRDLLQYSGTDEGPPNCVLITASWKANTRYELDFGMTNPMPAEGEESNNSHLKFWFAPVTYERIDASHLKYGVRGVKDGTMCAMSPTLESYGNQLYDACDVLNGTATAAEDCLTTLQAQYQSESLPGSDQYSSLVNVYKSANGLGVAVQDVTNSTCGANEAFSDKVGGECISCGSGEIEYTQTSQQPLSCACPSTHIQNVIGSPACGAAKSLIQTSATTSKEVAGSLCSFYTDKYEGLLNQQISALSVVHTYVQEFLDQAHLLLDRDEMARVNKTFVAEYMFDERVKGNTPTRDQGILPNCYNCNNGAFKDFNSGVVAEVKDVFFQAVHTFRLIGFALNSVGKWVGKRDERKDRTDR